MDKGSIIYGTRQEIINLLNQEPKSIAQLKNNLESSWHSIYQQLKILQEKGLVTGQREKVVGITKESKHTTIYRLTEEGKGYVKEVHNEGG